LQTKMNVGNISVIGFDADDTLWDNETLFQDVEARFRELMAPYCSGDDASAELFKTEMRHLHIYGFGVKSFTLSMVETALSLSGGNVPGSITTELLRLGQSLLTAPVMLLGGVEEVLRQLSGRFRLVLATKGDLLDQERKLERSGMVSYFHHIEVMSDKRVDDYKEMLRRLDVRPEAFLMVGNSLKSDILPVLQLGGEAVHIPYHVTWAHEATDGVNPTGRHYHRLDRIGELPGLFS